MKVKIIYDDGAITDFEEYVNQFISLEDVQVIGIKYSHAEITDDPKRHSGTSFSSLIIYNDLSCESFDEWLENPKEES